MKTLYALTISFLVCALMPTRGFAQECNCMLDIDSTFSVVPMNWGGFVDTTGEYRNDDASSGEIALPFTFNFYGVDQTSCFINNNGNVSFGQSYGTFTASGFPIADYPMVAAFWADVDTRDLGSGLVYYKMTDNALIVRYDHVGYFSQMSDKLNDFQLIISDGTSDLIPGGNNISFCYGDMQWTTGSASGGLEGFGGSPANVGANAGDGISYMQMGLFDATGDAFDGSYDLNDGVDYLDYSHIYFSTNPIDSNQAPIDVSNYCDTIVLLAGDSTAFFYYDADEDQDLFFSLLTDYEEYISISNGTSGMAMVNDDLIFRHDYDPTRVLGDRSAILHVAPNTPDGDYPFDLTATDNGLNTLSVTSSHVLRVGAGSVTFTDDITASNGITAYFNANQLLFKGINSNEISKITIFDVQGRKLYDNNRLSPDMNTQNWTEGIYFFTLQTNNGTFSGKVLKH